MDGGAEGDLEDAGAATGAGELGEVAAVVGEVVVGGGESGVFVVEEAGVGDGAADGGLVEAVLAHVCRMVGHIEWGRRGAQLLAVGVQLVATWRRDG